MQFNGAEVQPMPAAHCVCLGLFMTAFIRGVNWFFAGDVFSVGDYGNGAVSCTSAPPVCSLWVLTNYYTGNAEITTRSHACISKWDCTGYEQGAFIGSNTHHARLHTSGYYQVLRLINTSSQHLNKIFFFTSRGITVHIQTITANRILSNTLKCQSNKTLDIVRRDGGCTCLTVQVACWWLWEPITWAVPTSSGLQLAGSNVFPTLVVLVAVQPARWARQPGVQPACPRQSCTSVKSNGCMWVGMNMFAYIHLQNTTSDWIQYIYRSFFTYLFFIVSNIKNSFPWADILLK